MADAWPWTVLFAAVLLLTLLLTLFRRPHLLRPRLRRFSTVQIVSAISNGCLGLAYLFLGTWRLAENLKKFHSLLPVDTWLPTVLQGVVWALVGVTVSVGAPIRRLSVLAFLFAVFVSGSSLFAGGHVTPHVVFDVLSLPVAVLLLLCAYYRGDVARNGEAGVAGMTKFAGAGVCNTLSFWWLNSMMKAGREKTLAEEDMPKLREAERAEMCYLLYTEELEKLKRKNPSSQPSMLWVIICCHWRDIFLSGFFALLKIITLSAGPLLLNAFILVSEGQQSFQYEGYVLAFTLFVAKNLESLSQRQWYFRSRLIGLKVRSLLSAAIYKKQLRLSSSAKLRHSGGEIMNYFIVDAYRIGEFPYWFHQTWTTLLQLCIAMVILFRSVGLATLASLAAILLSVLGNAPLAKLQHKFQTKLMATQDKRLKATSEALVNMKVLKLYAWEKHFKGVVEALRKAEEKWLSAVQFWGAYNWFLFWLSPLLVSAATFGACYFLKVPLQANNVFTFVATLRLVQDPVRSISDVLAVVIQAKVAFARIVRFLDEPELESWTVRLKRKPENGEKPIVIKSADFSWEEGLSKSTLRNINFKIGLGEKVAVCGEVGSGKSTLLAAILGEVPKVHGSIQVYGKLAYVSQTAWIQTGTIQDNILFGSPMHHQRYRETLERCALVKDLELLPYGDLTEIGERGVNLSGGQKQRIQLARALYQNADIYLLDDPFSAVDAHTATTLFNEYVIEALSEKTVLLVTHQVDFLPAFDMVLLMSDGEILEADSYLRLLETNREFQELVNAHKETAGAESLVHIRPNKNDQTDPAKEISKSYAENQHMESKGDQLIKLEERETGDRGLKPYKQYLNQNKGYLYFSLTVLAHIIFVIGQILQNTWLAVSVDDPDTTKLRMIVVYLLIGLGSALFLFVRSLSVVVLGVSSSHSLFLQLLNSLFRAPMAFYDSTPLGRILSRVSADLSIVDLDIPFSLIAAVGTTISCIANLGVLAVMAWQVLLVSIPTVFATIQLQKYYFSTAKELMRINGTTKSLMANHLAESVAGAMTIRAFEEENRFFAKNLNLVDISASPFFLSFSAKEWLIQRLETLCAIVLASAALCMVLLPPATFSSGFIGMTLSYGLSLNMQLVFAIQNNCNLENNIISVERLNQYMNVPSEAPEVIKENRPPANWPSVGNIEIHDLKIRYRSNTPLVLRGISCTFFGGHKIGIVGRTGSGKTTLIGALFRLVEPTAGKIIVDGIDIAEIGLHDLRSRLGIIPQDPTLFNGTVRYNLDPLSQYSDQKIWEVLGKCQLREAVIEKVEGLDSLVVDEGSNWSMGQRQLFCLGRALLRRSRILVLDEATASIDNATDMILQRTIRTEFTDCTVITVAHRIPTVMDCTMVLTMSDGKIIEYDEPMKLMKREGSLFGKLVKEYWSHSQSFVSL